MFQRVKDGPEGGSLPRPHDIALMLSIEPRCTI